MSNEKCKLIMEYLTPKRMSSIGNIAYATHYPVSEIILPIKELEMAGKIRLATSGCSSDCSSCSSCGSEPQPKPEISERTIAISLER